MEGDSINLSMRKALALRQAWLRGSWQAHRAVALAFSSGTTGAMSSKTNLKQDRMLWSQADPLFGNSADSFLIIWDHQ